MTRDKYKIIRRLIAKYPVDNLCKIAKVNRTGINLILTL